MNYIFRLINKIYNLKQGISLENVDAFALLVYDYPLYAQVQ